MIVSQQDCTENAHTNRVCKKKNKVRPNIKPSPYGENHVEQKHCLGQASCKDLEID